MTININLNADASGNGVDLHGVIEDFNANFSLGSGNHGSFYTGLLDTTMAFSGTQYYVEDQDSSSSYTGGVLATAGDNSFAYDLSSHTITGDLDGFSFGETLTAKSDLSGFEFTDSSVDITNLGLSGSDTNDVLVDIYTGSTDALESAFASQGVAINGSAGADVIEGWSGDDVLTGNGGADVFEFDASASFGNDTITDFENGSDQIGLNYDDVTISGDSSHTVITHANGTVTLAGVDFATIDQNDFV